MKRIIVSLLTICILVSSFAMVGAENNAVQISVVYDTAKSAIVVSGTIENARANQFLALEVKNPSGAIVYADQMTLPYQAGALKAFEFAPFNIHLKNSTGNYAVTVYAEYAGASNTASYSFVGADLQFNAISGVANAIKTATTESELEAALSANAETLGIDMTAFNSLNSKSIALKIIGKKTYNLPDNYNDDAKIEQVQENIVSFREEWKNAIIVAQYNDIEEINALNSWLELNGADFSVDNPQTADKDEKALYDVVLDAMAEDEFIARVSGHSDLDTMEKIQNSLYEDALLTILETRHYSERRELLEKFYAFFGIDKNALNELTTSEKGELYESFGGSFESCLAAGKAFNELVDEIKEDNGNTGGGSGSSGGYRGNSGGITAPPLTSNTNMAAVIKEFPDMNTALWAKEAVTVLSENGVVNGDENGNFNPNKNVTRAEFIKMIVLATGLKPSNVDAAFSDVSSKDWYWQYTNAAKSAGLIEGDNENCFKPNNFITRQDMTVIIYRAYKINQEMNCELTFNDSNSISNYAKEAVAYLASKGIVSGKGNNIFAPLDNATRAEAAQMIFNAVYNK